MPTPLTLVIVGGVAGGASAAARARRMNESARIIIIEKDAHASFANCGLPYYIGGEIAQRDKLIVAKPARFKNWLNIEVRTRQLVQKIDRSRKGVSVLNRDTGEVYEQTYDKLILAPGASPIVPPIPNAGAPNVFTLRNLDDTDKIKNFVTAHAGAKAVVVGAGFIGLEMVEMLHKLGMKVALVEMLEQVLPPVDPEMAGMVEAELKKQGVELHLGSALSALETSGAEVNRVVLANGKKIDADLVILGLGVRPNVALAKDAGLSLGSTGGISVNRFAQTSDPDIYAVGDAVEYQHGITGQSMRIPLAGPANRAGRVAGEHAAVGQSPPVPVALGTSIVRVFGVTAAMTGLSTKAAAKANIASRAVWVPGNHHAGYYPGAQEMVLKLIYAPDTGKVLGAQAAGGAGVDKRIDVIATAIHFGAKVDDLTELDLAYAPPFGSAKDPVHMAGFVAQNDLRKVGPITGPASVESLPAHVQVLDVRTQSEWNQGHLPDAKWIPLDDLRARLGELDRARPVVTVCRGGQRAYYAARILMQNGFADVKVMTGGMFVKGFVKA